MSFTILCQTTEGTATFQKTRQVRSKNLPREKNKVHQNQRFTGSVRDRFPNYPSPPKVPIIPKSLLVACSPIIPQAVPFVAYKFNIFLQNHQFFLLFLTFSELLTENSQTFTGLGKNDRKADRWPPPHVCSTGLTQSRLPAIDSNIFTDCGCLRRFPQARTDFRMPSDTV